MQEEEATLLPQLAAVLDAESQLRLGILFEAAKVGRGAFSMLCCAVLRCAELCCAVLYARQGL